MTNFNQWSQTDAAFAVEATLNLLPDQHTGIATTFLDSRFLARVINCILVFGDTALFAYV